VPFEYLIRHYTTITGPDQLSPSEQAALVAQLQVGLREDGEHDAARKGIVVLLGKLRNREEVTYRTRTDVDAILGSIDEESRTQPPLATDTQPPVTSDNTAEAGAAGRRQRPASASGRPGRARAGPMPAAQR
jgi:hypothetical protein